MSTRTKGAKFEKEFEDVLISLGYTIQRVKGSSRWNKNVDFFGCWDLLGFNNHEWILVQVKSDYRPSRIRPLTEWILANNPPNCKFLYVVRKQGRLTKGECRWILYDAKTGDKIQSIEMATKTE